MKTEGIVGVVSGGGSGLGEATCRGLLESGATGVVVLDTDAERGAALQEELGSGCLFVATDVSSEDEVVAAVDRGLDAFGRIDVAVAAAAIAAPMKMFGSRGPMSMERFERVVAVNLVGAVHLLKAAASAMLHNEPQDGERGLLVNVASGAAFEGQVGQIGYGATKAAMVGMTLPLARELGEYGIRVMTIAPGAFDTPMWSQVPAKTRADMETLVPFPRRFGRAGEFASMVDELIRNPMHNGRTYRLDAGLTLPASSDV